MTTKSFEEEDRLDCYYNNWRRRTTLTDCKTCDDYKKCLKQTPLTPGEALEDFYEALGLYKLLDWITEKLEG